MNMLQKLMYQSFSCFGFIPYICCDCETYGLTAGFDWWFVRFRTWRCNLYFKKDKVLSLPTPLLKMYPSASLLLPLVLSTCLVPGAGMCHRICLTCHMLAYFARSGSWPLPEAGFLGVLAIPLIHHVAASGCCMLISGNKQLLLQTPVPVQQTWNLGLLGI